MRTGPPTQHPQQTPDHIQVAAQLMQMIDTCLEQGRESAVNRTVELIRQTVPWLVTDVEAYIQRKRQELQHRASQRRARQ